MKLELDIPPDLERELAAEAARLQLPLPEYAMRVLATGRSSASVPCTGSELVAYWPGERLVGSRRDILDSQAHARAAREHGQRRERH